MTIDMARNTILAELSKNSAEVILIQSSEFKNRKAIDIRTFYKTDIGEMGPTKKGINIPLALYPAFKKALLEAEKEMVKNGIIDQEDLDEVVNE